MHSCCDCGKVRRHLHQNRCLICHPKHLENKRKIEEEIEKQRPKSPKIPMGLIPAMFAGMLGASLDFRL